MEAIVIRVEAITTRASLLGAIGRYSGRPDWVCGSPWATCEVQEHPLFLGNPHPGGQRWIEISANVTHTHKHVNSASLHCQSSFRVFEVEAADTYDI